MTRATPERRRFRQYGTPSIQAYIPPYLRNFVFPYHGDFCQSTIFHPVLITQLMAEGFLPIATDGVLLPKLHRERCVIALPKDLHVSKSNRKKSKRFSITINTCFDTVMEAILEQHKNCWLHPPLLAAFREMYRNNETNTAALGKRVLGGTRTCAVRLYSIEIWNEQSGALVAGEIGYTVGSIYTSMTGFSREDSSGSVQMVALGELLSDVGFTLWDLGMFMQYKADLGAQIMPRAAYVKEVHRVREDFGSLTLPEITQPVNCRLVLTGEWRSATTQTSKEQRKADTGGEKHAKKLKPCKQQDAA